MKTVEISKTKYIDPFNFNNKYVLHANTRFHNSLRNKIIHNSFGIKFGK